MATKYKKNGQTYWRQIITYGRGPDGKLLKKEFLGKTKKDMHQKQKDFELFLEQGMTFEDAAMRLKHPSFTANLPLKDEHTRLLGDTIRSWIFDVKRVSDDVKASSFQRYEGLYRLYIKDSVIDKIPVEKITSNDFQRYYNFLFEKMGKSHNVIKELNKLIKAFFNYEIFQERLQVNPCAGKKIALPGGSKQETRTQILNDEELKLFIQSLTGHKFEMLFLLGIRTGLRIGEMLALKIDDLDIDNASIQVVATQYGCNVFDSDGNKEYHMMRYSTKNRQNRTVPIPSNLVPKLKQYLLDRKKHKFKIGVAFVEENYLFPNMIGGPLGYSNVRKEYVKIFEANSLPYRRIHSLRHSYASLLNNNCASIVNIQELLGHRDPKTTQIYIHTSDEMKRRDVDKLQII